MRWLALRIRDGAWRLPSATSQLSDAGLSMVSARTNTLSTSQSRIRWTFISAGDTPYVWELSIWYHTLNVGFRTKIAGETDFPCIDDARVGEARSYVKGMVLSRMKTGSTE